MHIRLPYNAILGYPSLAKFMAVTHHGYNVLKMPGSGGVITFPCEEKDAVCSLERAFQAASIEDPDSRGKDPPEVVPKKKKTPLSSRPGEVGISGGATSGSAPVQGAPPSNAQESVLGALLGQGSGALFWRASDFVKITREALWHHLEACFIARFPQEGLGRGKPNP